MIFLLGVQNEISFWIIFELAPLRIPTEASSWREERFYHENIRPEDSKFCIGRENACICVRYLESSVGKLHIFLHERSSNHVLWEHVIKVIFLPPAFIILFVKDKSLFFGVIFFFNLVGFGTIGFPLRQKGPIEKAIYRQLSKLIDLSSMVWFNQSFILFTILIKKN